MSGAAVSVLFAGLLLSGCPADSAEVRPPADQFFFPTGIALSSDEGSLFVLNANSDLRYDSGSISVVDLAKVKSIANDWLSQGTVPAGLDCEIDNTSPSALVCNEAEAIGSTVRVGNFATEIGVQLLDDGSNRVFAAVRGDPSLTWMDFDLSSKRLACGGSGDVPRCDDDHRLNRMRDDAAIGNLASEPFGLYVDSAAGFVILTHLTGGAVSLASAPTNGNTPVLSDVRAGLFEADAASRVRSALGASARLPGGRVYVTSRSEARVRMFTVAEAGEFPTLVPTDFFFMRDVRPSDNGRGIAFNETGDQAYIVNRSPPTLQIIDTSIGDAAVPANELIRVVEICSSASNLVVGDVGKGERVYVACFREGQVWAIDPNTGSVDAIVVAGRGPQGIVLSEDKQQLYVTNFLEDTIAVIDLDPASSTENRVVLKLGRPRQSGGQ